ncbi:MAG: hypothetical protein EZS28_004855 [Streblomastix strix]|uniref:C2 domain-containing protein n=1 Tax=Streblomastix strix TaxID=222440 RepID=A0A5J4WZ44_9EUKA|nr:MAG: hypothetical protein EZS28_004855 [Streblomastix strix]
MRIQKLKKEKKKKRLNREKKKMILIMFLEQLKQHLKKQETYNYPKDPKMLQQSPAESNPFIKVIIGEYEGITKRYQQTNNARFDETFTFDFDPTETKDRVVLFELWDYDSNSENDDQMGKVTIPIRDFFNNHVQFTLVFQGINNNLGLKIGEVDITVCYMPNDVEQGGDEQQQGGGGNSVFIGGEQYYQAAQNKGEDAYDDEFIGGEVIDEDEAHEGENSSRSDEENGDYNKPF